MTYLLAMLNYVRDVLQLEKEVPALDLKRVGAITVKRLNILSELACLKRRKKRAQVQSTKLVKSTSQRCGGRF